MCIRLSLGKNRTYLLLSYGIQMGLSCFDRSITRRLYICIIVYRVMEKLALSMYMRDFLIFLRTECPPSAALLLM